MIIFLDSAGAVHGECEAAGPPLLTAASSPVRPLLRSYSPVARQARSPLRRSRWARRPFSRLLALGRRSGLQAVGNVWVQGSPAATEDPSAQHLHPRDLSAPPLRLRYLTPPCFHLKAVLTQHLHLFALRLQLSRSHNLLRGALCLLHGRM